jgi:Carboxypeptidase regulatory-like domain
MDFRRMLGFAAALCLLAATVGQGQTSRGSISGSVLDSSGAAIPAAEVEILLNSTGAVSKFTSSSSGEFVFPDLQVGIYTVTITHSGFQTQKIDNVQVEVGKVTSLPVTLSVAKTTQTVEVSAVAAALETQQTALNAVVTERAVQEIPLNGRDYRQLLVLTPGFVSGAGTHESMNGNRDNQNNWQLDGVDNNDFWHNAEAINQGSISGVAGVLLPIDSIAEFNQQSVGGADFGRNPGSMVNVVIKSGTNEIHGSAYYFNRNEALAVTSPFYQPGTPSELRNNNYGFSFGGPAVKDKLFFFVSYEGQHFISGNAILATVPSTAWVNDVQTNVLSKYDVAINPVMNNLLQNLWPSSISSAPFGSGDYSSGDNNSYRSNNFVGRIDYNISSKNRFFLRSIIGTGDATAYAGSVFGQYFQSVPSRQENWAAVLTSSLTPKLVNQVLVGVNYFLQNFDDASHGADPPSLGFNTGVTSQDFGTPSISITGFDNGGVGETPNLGRTDTTWHVTDDLSYSHGSHVLKFGGEFRRADLWVHYLREARGSFTFNGSAGPWANDSTLSTPEKALADFLGGYIGPGLGSIAIGNPVRDWYVNSFAGYFQDNWQVKPTLNVNFGVRYDYNTPFYDPTHQISTFWPTFTSTSTPGLAFPGMSGSPIDSLYPPDKNNFAPRLGFAYTPSRGGKTVIRGAWGLYYDVPNGNLFIDNRGGPTAGRGASRNPAGANPVFNISNPNLVTVQPDVYLFGSSTPQPPFGIWAVDQGLRSPYVQNFSLNVQRQLSPHTVLQVGYVGSQARKLLITRDMNQPPASATPYADIQAARPYNAAFPEYGQITELTSSGNSHYNSLQASLRNTSWKGLTGQLSYTLSHARDDQSAARNAWPADSNNFQADWGNADFDTRHNVSGYLLYDVPQRGHSMPRLTRGWELSAFFSYDSGFPFTVSSGVDNSNTGQLNDRADLTGSPFSGVTQPGPILQAGGVAIFNPTAFSVNMPGTFGNTQRNQFYGPSFKALDFSVIKNTAITERLNAQFRVEVFNVFNILNLAPPDAGASDGSAFGLSSSTLATYNGAPGIGSGEPLNVQLALKLIW